MSLRVQQRASIVWGTKKPEGVALSGADAAALSQLAAEDAGDALYNCLTTFLLALRGIRTQSYSWSIVKLYYSLFYLSRATLFFGDVVIVYFNRTPYQLRLSPGATGRKLKGTTHQVTLSQFGVHFPNAAPFRSSVAGENSVGWMIHQRERVNYTQAVFVEPECDAAVERIDREGVRATLLSWIAQPKRLAFDAFDPSWAMVALPFLAVCELARAMEVGTPLWSYGQRAYIKDLCRVDGPLLKPICELFLGFCRV